MIDGYFVRYENNEKVIYIYLNNNYEFASFNKNIFTNLKKFYNCNKFKIVISGIAVATLFINKESNKSNLFVNEYNQINPKEYNYIKLKNEKMKEEEEKKENEIKSNEHIILTEPIINTQMVTVNRQNGTIINLELEDYIIGVVSSEMPANFNIEALKAQAIVARTYTLKRISENKILTDNSSTQNYYDINQLKNLWGKDFDMYYNKIKSAVLETKGIYLTYNNYFIDSVYHSTSNGMTEDAISVWGYDIPYLKSVDSSYDVFVSSYKRSINLSYEEISKKLNMNITPLSSIILTRNSTNRINEVIIDDVIIKGITLRDKLGLRSNDYEIEKNDNGLVITTYGYGHGVGMSQYGANEMAKTGCNYIAILNHYYSNIKIVS